MKHFMLITLLIVPFLANSQDIQEAYQSFEHSRKKNLQNSSENKAMIDKANHFIKVYNPSDEYDVVVFKAFLKSDGTKVFAFQYDASQPALGLRMTRTEFYTFSGNAWKEVSNQTYPLLSYALFWGSNDLPAKGLQTFNVHLRLPQQGNTILAESYPAVSMQFSYDFVPKGYEETFKARRFTAIALSWNSTKGTFEIGEKY